MPGLKLIHVVLCPPETQLKLKSREVWFAYNLFHNGPIPSKVCSEYGSDTAILSAKFQSDWTTETGIMHERDFARFEFKMNFGRISYCTAPLNTANWFHNLDGPASET